MSEIKRNNIHLMLVRLFNAEGVTGNSCSTTYIYCACHAQVFVLVAIFIMFVHKFQFKGRNLLLWSIEKLLMKSRTSGVAKALSAIRRNRYTSSRESYSLSTTFLCRIRKRTSINS